MLIYQPAAIGRWRTHDTAVTSSSQAVCTKYLLPVLWVKLQFKENKKTLSFWVTLYWDPLLTQLENIYIFYAFWSLYSRVPNSVYLLPVLRHLWIRTQSFRLVSNHLATTGDKRKIFIPRLVAGGCWLYAWNRLLKPKSRRHRDQ